MLKKYYLLFLFSFLICLSSCDDDGEPANLESADERRTQAKNELINELIAPENGWKVSYIPSEDAGMFNILMKFNSEGEVSILSDVSNSEENFFEDVIPYRIDILNETKVVLETYGVFHYLFELYQASFGGEFQFVFKFGLLG